MIAGPAAQARTGRDPYGVSLAEAREGRRSTQAHARGSRPGRGAARSTAAARVANAKALTFDQCAGRYIEAHRAGWKSDKHAAQWAATVKTYVSPTFGSLPVAEIDTGMVMQVLSPIWAKKSETANRVRGRIESVFDWAEVRAYRGGGKNPAQWRGHLDQLLPATRQGAEGGAPFRPALRRAAAVHDCASRSARASRRWRPGVCILTATRTSETLNATWSEIDLDKKSVGSSGRRMKAGREHRVPLSAARAFDPRGDEELRTSDYIFPGAKRGRPLSNMALLVLLSRMQRCDLTAHGFRSTFRDWVGEQTNFASELAEVALAHMSATRWTAYRRGDLFDKRVALMDAWSSYCHVVTFRCEQGDSDPPARQVAP